MLGDSFKKLVLGGELEEVRKQIQEGILKDKDLGALDEMLDFAEIRLDGFYDGHKGELKGEASWTKDYLDFEIKRLSENFSRERLDHIREIISRGLETEREVIPKIVKKETCPFKKLGIDPEKIKKLILPIAIIVGLIYFILKLFSREED